jgi:starvation-inducible outer membrane lipoprotein
VERWRMKRVAYLLVPALLLSGCYDVLPPMLHISNRTPHELVIEARSETGAIVITAKIEAGRVEEFAPNDDGCDARPWIAKAESGEVVAQVPGACKGHTWTIRGPGDATYE